ncbi:gamma-secretase subunit PEN-2 isoform X1 [Petaurus breviceps papuanus]|uniref:gamma-secretase subunit PEN-2 isoform X1 n=1 Tax=Petaurus breviceps papuanus TaxID=3040969 RepID=UPI0036DD5161
MRTEEGLQAPEAPVALGASALRKEEGEAVALPGPSSGPRMNLERVSNEEKLNLCRKYYLGGFALLPFLWLVNVLWFFREAFLAPAYEEQGQIKGYVWRSALGLVFWLVALTSWITVFQINRARWGALGDYLSFTIPLGIP